MQIRAPYRFSSPAVAGASAARDRSAHPSHKEFHSSTGPWPHCSGTTKIRYRQRKMLPVPDAGPNIRHQNPAAALKRSDPCPPAPGTAPDETARNSGYTHANPAGSHRQAASAIRSSSPHRQDIPSSPPGIAYTTDGQTDRSSCGPAGMVWCPSPGKPHHNPEIYP